MRALLDTSILIAKERGRPLGPLPDEAAISVATIAELHAGVLMAKDLQTRARRIRTLGRAERSFYALPIDADIARVFASLFSEARQRGRRPKTMDMWIAATAVRYGLPVFTRDADFDAIPRVQVKKAIAGG